MKAVVVSGPNEFDWAEIAPPEPAPNEALVRIEVCGICNSTDQYLLAGAERFRPGFPFILGHEAVGTVVEAGPDCRRFRVGDRVVRPTCLFPGEERFGLRSGWGGFAEFGLVRDDPEHPISQRQIVMPPGLPPETAFLSIALAETRAFLEQLSEAHGSVRGQGVVVLGTGIAGLTLTRWARDLGANPVITLGRRPERLLLARRSGAHLGLNSADPELIEKVRERTAGRMAEWLLEAVGDAAALARQLPLLAPPAVVGVYGAAPARDYDELFASLPEGLIGARPGPEEFRYTRAIAEQLRDGQLEPGLWRTHLWQPAELHTAFAQVAAGQVVKGCVRLN